jgi:3-hydroxyisobutyrate dehydrogenase-like beta-hydroxyacid dehydrogenase
VSMLPEGAHVKYAFLTPKTGALASTSKSKKLFLDSSTIDASSSLEVGEAVRKSGLGDFSDTPVSVSSSIDNTDPRVVLEVQKLEA